MSIGIRILQGMSRFARAFRKEEKGAAAVQFALMALPLTVTVFGMVDVSKASAAKGHLQDALDAAALAAARSTATTDAEAQSVGEGVLRVDLAGARATLRSSSFRIVGSKVSGVAVTRTNVVAFGGSSSVLSSASCAFATIRSASSMITTRRRPSNGR